MPIRDVIVGYFLKRMPMKRRFLILLSTIFALAAIGLVIIQISQTRKSAMMSDNLFNISVNNAIDEVFSQLDQMKVEDYVSQEERYRLLRFRRIDEMNEKMQDLIRNNSELFYDEERIIFGVSTQDSVFAQPNAKILPAEENILNQYNTLLNARNRLVNDLDLGHKSNAMSEAVAIDVTKFNFPLLDSLIKEELIINGVDIAPSIGVLLDNSDTLLYCSEDADTDELATTAFKYVFTPNGITANENIYVVLAFPASPIILSSDANIYTIISICMIILISALFIFSIRTIWAQRKLDEMKTDFINNMTHEIKTPIATIGLACEMLNDNTVTNDKSSMQNFVNIISDENRRMRVLIETLLQSAKMSSKKYTISLKETDLNTVVESAIQSFNLTIENRHGIVEKDLNPITGTLFADELHISNMIHNLIDNAIKYSTHEVFLHISTRQENDYAIIQIEDHGIGISKEDQKHIFEKFYRVSTGNVHNVKGFGIGLNYVSQVVMLHHGEISLASEPGKGSTFTIKLPLN